MKNISETDFVGNPAQLNSVKYIQFLEGKATGMKAYEVVTAGGFSITIAIDRGLDIPELSIKGKNISFLSSTGLVNSTYFTEDGNTGFMKNFNVGFLTTGGLAYMGKSNKNKGLHGTISNTPAYNYFYKILDKEIKVCGNVKESVMFGTNLSIYREITISKNELVINIHDTLFNNGDESLPYMLLYHNNYGYPFLTPKTTLCFNATKSLTRSYQDTEAKDFLDLNDPKSKRPEQVFFHKLKNPEFTINSPNTNLSLKVKYSGDTLPVLNEWKLERTKNFVLGMEPGTNDVNGFENAQKNNHLKVISPNERIEFNINFNFKENK